MSSCTNRVLRNEIYIAARRDRRSRDCFDARVIAPSFVDPAMDLSAIGPRRHPHNPPKGCRKMRWILISTSGGNGRNRFVPALQDGRPTSLPQSEHKDLARILETQRSDSASAGSPRDRCFRGRWARSGPRDLTPEFSCDAFDGRGRKMELQGAVCRVAPPSQRSGLSRSRHTNVTRLGMRVLPTAAIADLHVAGATGNENDQMIPSSGSYEFLGLCRILVGPDYRVHLVADSHCVPAPRS
jgi:hypothetical protein